MVATRLQKKEAVNRIAEELYDSLVEGQWQEARALLQEIPAGEHLPRKPPSRADSIFWVAVQDDDLPLDLFRSIMGSFENLLAHEDWLVRALENADGYAPLHLCIVGRLDIVRLEIVARICPEALLHAFRIRERDCSAISLFAFTLLGQPSTPDGSEVAWCAEGVVAMILRVCPECARLEDAHGATALHQAVRYRMGIPTIKAIIDADPTLIQATSDRGFTPLHLAAGLQETEACVQRFKLLIDYSIESDMKATSHAGVTPLHAVVGRITEYTDRMISLFVESCPSACLADTVTPFPSLDVFRELHAEKLVVSSFDEEEMTLLTRLGNCAWLLHTALPAHHRPTLHSVLGDQSLPTSIIPCMICASAAELSQRDDEGNLPIHVLANRSPTWDSARLYSMAVKTMIHLYPEACRIADAQGRLPLELMKQSGHSLLHGMDPLLRAHPSAAMDLGMDHVSLRFLFAQVGRVEADPLYRFLQGAPDTIKTVTAVAIKQAGNKHKRGR